MTNASVACAVALLLVSPTCAATRIEDPKSFVTGVFQHLVAAPNRPAAPADIYSPRLDKALRDDKRKAQGEVGCLDFDFWTNGQDSKIANVSITALDRSPDLKIVIAKFRNIGEPQEIHFDFVRIGGRWLLDDVHSRLGEKWTLSQLLRCRP